MLVQCYEISLQNIWQVSNGEASLVLTSTSCVCERFAENRFDDDCVLLYARCPVCVLNE